MRYMCACLTYVCDAGWHYIAAPAEYHGEQPAHTGHAQNFELAGHNLELERLTGHTQPEQYPIQNTGYGGHTQPPEFNEPTHPVQNTYGYSYPVQWEQTGYQGHISDQEVAQREYARVAADVASPQRRHTRVRQEQGQPGHPREPVWTLRVTPHPNH